MNWKSRRSCCKKSWQTRRRRLQRPKTDSVRQRRKRFVSIVILMPFWQSWEVHSLKALMTASVKSKLLIWTWTYPTLTLMLQPRLPFSPSLLRVQMSCLPMMFLVTERPLKLRITLVTLTCKRRMSKIPQFSSSFFFF